MTKLIDYTMDDLYVAVRWPESQALMEEEWFREEAILDTESKLGDSTYLIPLSRLEEL